MFYIILYRETPDYRWASLTGYRLSYTDKDTAGIDLEYAKAEYPDYEVRLFDVKDNDA